MPYDDTRGGSSWVTLNNKTCGGTVRTLQQGKYDKRTVILQVPTTASSHITGFHNIDKSHCASVLSTLVTKTLVVLAVNDMK